jgi:anti-sigma factor RsiW
MAKEATVDCGQVRVELAAHALGGLESAEAQAVEDHLAGCPACGAVRERHTDVVGLMGTVHAWEVASGAPVAGPGSERATALRAFAPTERDGPRGPRRGHA